MAATVSVADLIPVADLRRLTVNEYLTMARAGIFDEDNRVELLDGVIVNMSPINPPHAFAVSELAQMFMEGLRGSAVVRVKDTVQLPHLSAPQPDIAVVRGPRDVYARRHPGPEDILLIVEVSDSTLAFDLRVKLPLYARAGIPDFWIADVVHRQLLVHRAPAGAGYAEVTTYLPGVPVAPLAFPELRIDPASLFPRER
jgi:Uma2 family endonuclease